MTGRQLALCLIAFCVFQSAVITYLRTDVTGGSRLDWHGRITSIIYQHFTTHGFGSMARQVARTADLAETLSHDLTLEDSEMFELAVAKLFPWWRANTLRYYPWKAVAPVGGSGQEKGAGIVISVGNRNVLSAASLIVALRSVLNSTLPIELAYVGDSDLSPRWRSWLMKLVDDRSIFPLDLTQVYDNSLVDLRTWDTKPFALIASRYPQTMLLDADAFFFETPDALFDTHPGLRNTGTLFLHDRSKFWGDGRRESPHARLEWLAKQIAEAGRQPSGFLNLSSLLWAADGVITEAMDSCAVFVDKSRPRVYMAMLFAAWMNGAGPRKEFYKYWYGDKEAYWIACELTGTDYFFELWTSMRMGIATAMPGRNAKSTAQLEGDCTQHMIHANADGSAPLLGNGGIARLPQWTHWYLARPIKEALAEIKQNMSIANDTYWGTELGLGTHEQYRDAIVESQVAWGPSCAQHEPERWRPLAPETGDVVARMAVTYDKLAIAFAAAQAS